MKCPDCGREMVWIAKGTITGREICDYYCSACGLIAVVDDGVALWKIIGSSPKDATDQEDGPRILQITRLDATERDEMNAFIRLRFGETKSSEEARQARKKAGARKSRAGLVSAMAIFIICGLLFAAAVTGNLNYYTVTAALRSLVYAVFFRD